MDVSAESVSAFLPTILIIFSAYFIGKKLVIKPTILKDAILGLLASLPVGIYLTGPFAHIYFYSSTQDKN